MRTTIRMNESLLKQAKIYAAQLGMSLTSLIEEGLKYRMRLKPKRKAKKISLPTFKGKGLQTPVNLSSNAALQDLIDLT